MKTGSYNVLKPLTYNLDWHLLRKLLYKIYSTVKYGVSGFNMLDNS